MSTAVLVIGLAIAALVLVIVELVAEHRDALAWAVLCLAIAVILTRI